MAMVPRNVFVTGASGYIGSAVARAFVAAGWKTFGLVRSPDSTLSLSAEEIIPVLGDIDDELSYAPIKAALPATIDVIVSATEDTRHFAQHFRNIIHLFKTLSAASTSNGCRPLVISTAGGKDYGIGPHLSTNPELESHSEISPPHPPQFAAERVKLAPQFFEHAKCFGAVLVRPTNVYGRASSYYGICFRAGARAALAADPAKQVLIAPSQPEWICQSLHIDDCAEAYVAIASVPRQAVEGEVFNISSEQYETSETILRRIAEDYGLLGGVKYIDIDEAVSDDDRSLAMVVGFPQRITSRKLTRLTGWKPRRPSFIEAFSVYRKAYEASVILGDRNIERIEKNINTLAYTVENP